MQQAVQNTPSPLERNIKVTVPVAQIEAEINARLKRLARTAKMQGFRPGHVPLKMVERQYGFQVRQEVVSDTVQKSFADAVKDQNYRVAGYPRFQPAQPQEGAPTLEYTATFEVYPEVAMADLSAKKVERPKVEAVLGVEPVADLGRMRRQIGMRVTDCVTSPYVGLGVLDGDRGFGEPFGDVQPVSHDQAIRAAA